MDNQNTNTLEQEKQLKDVLILVLMDNQNTTEQETRNYAPMMS